MAQSLPKSPKNVVPIAREEIVDFKVIVAIDFGTHGTALGYAVVGDDEKECEIHTAQDWCKNVDHKNKTDILLTSQGKFLAFGDRALQLYMQADDDDSDSDSEDGDDDEDDDDDSDSDDDDRKREKLRKKHMLFESFKMALYEKKTDGSEGDIRGKLACVDGRKLDTATVFIAALTHMKEQIFKTFKANHVEVKSIDEIQWILTVPAIWSDRAKYKMEYWAVKAKLINRNIFNHLRIVYEPDCASISCQYEEADKESKSKSKLGGKSTFGIGERYVLIDAGGGTVDIAWHQVKAEYSMEEIHHPTGGPWGSDYIDGHFERLLEEIFGLDALKPFKEFFSANFTKITDNFRKSKMSFYNNRSEKFHKVQLTTDFMLEIPKYSANKFGVASDIDPMATTEPFNKIINEARPFGLQRGHLYMEQDTLFMSSQIWREHLFDKVLDPMIAHVKEFIPKVNAIEDKDGDVKNIKYLLCAGGLASSAYLKYRIHDAFGMNSRYKLSILIPRLPILSVIDGALKLGLKPNYIKTRRLKYTYGIAVDRSMKNVDVKTLPPGYLENNRYIHPNTHKRTVRNLFSKWVEKNAPVDIGDAITKGYRRFHQKEKTSKISIYCSGEPDPVVVEGRPLASVIVPFPPEYKGLPFTVQFYFGDTKIKAKVFFKDAKSNDSTETILSEDLQLVYETV